jgi:hypothetical protein
MKRTEDEYRRDLAKGQAYEEHIYRVLAAFGERLTPHRTFALQMLKGENREKNEIKRDGLFRRYGNLFIETNERSPMRPRWRLAGIYEHTQPRWFTIGDEETIWIFAAARLRSVMPPALGYRSHRRRKVTETAAGWALPVKRADEWALVKIADASGLFPGNGTSVVPITGADDPSTPPSLLPDGRRMSGGE